MWQVIQIFRNDKAVDKIRRICGFDSSLGPQIPALAPFAGCSVLSSHSPHLVCRQFQRHYTSWFLVCSCSCTHWQVTYLICVCFSYFPFYIFSSLCLMVPVYLSCELSASACLEMPLKLKNEGVFLIGSLTHVFAWLLSPHGLVSLVLRICVFTLT